MSGLSSTFELNAFLPEIRGSAVAQLTRRFGKFAPFAAGGLLLVAASFKTYQLWTNDLPTTGWLSFRWLFVALIETEAFIGLALLFGLWSRIARRAGQLMFAVFGIFAIYRTVNGAGSCACFGSVEVQPLLMACLDVTLLTFLTLWTPPAANIPDGRLLWALPILFAVAAFPAVVLVAMGETLQLIEVSPASTDLGDLKQGERRDFIVLLRNTRAESVLIDRIESSCPCLESKRGSLVLAPFETVSVAFELNLGQEPDFRGELVLRITGLDDSGDIVFTAHVETRVSKLD